MPIIFSYQILGNFYSFFVEFLQKMNDLLLSDVLKKILDNLDLSNIGLEFINVRICFCFFLPAVHCDTCKTIQII